MAWRFPHFGFGEECSSWCQKLVVFFERDEGDGGLVWSGLWSLDISIHCIIRIPPVLAGVTCLMFIKYKIQQTGSIVLAVSQNNRKIIFWVWRSGDRIIFYYKQHITLQYITNFCQYQYEPFVLYFTTKYNETEFIHLFNPMKMTLLKKLRNIVR